MARHGLALGIEEGRPRQHINKDSSCIETSNDKNGTSEGDTTLHRDATGVCPDPGLNSSWLNFKNFPCVKAVLLITLVNATFFIQGLYQQNLDLNDVSLTLPVSPNDDKRLWFYSISPVTCEDKRSEFWRLFSYSFVHAGAQHILGNTSALLMFGYITEKQLSYGFLSTLLIYFISVIVGSIGHNYFRPYQALIGCSAGVYGLIGASMGLIIMDKDRIEKCKYWNYVALVILQVTGDLLMYFFFYDNHTGYNAHIYGFVGGFCSCLCSYWWKEGGWKKVCFAIAFTVIFCLLLFHINRYCSVFPPSSIGDSVVTCCELIFQTAEQVGIRFEAVMEKYYCSFNSSTDRYELHLFYNRLHRRHSQKRENTVSFSQ
jgi:membrane associated rhomboid family serine protease